MYLARVKRGSNLNGARSILANVFSSWKSVLPKTCPRCPRETETNVKCVVRATVCECELRCTVHGVRCAVCGARAQVSVRRL